MKLVASHLTLVFCLLCSCGSVVAGRPEPTGDLIIWMNDGVGVPRTGVIKGEAQSQGDPQESLLPTWSLQKAMSSCNLNYQAEEALHYHVFSVGDVDDPLQAVKCVKSKTIEWFSAGIGDRSNPLMADQTEFEPFHE